VSSGTAALAQACLALDLGPGDLLWTSPISFLASASCAVMCGAAVDFVDIDPATRNLSVEALEQKLRAAAATGRLPKVVVAVHFAGQPCDMESIQALAHEYGFRVIEDAAHALGARSDDVPVGACRHSDATVFSFHPVKSITTGEGGAVLSNDPELLASVRLLRSHGMERNPDDSDQGAWYYEQRTLGFNYRLSDLHAALGLSQLQRLDEAIERRRSLAERYAHMLHGLPLDLPRMEPGSASAWHLYPVGFHAGDAMRCRVHGRLAEAGIQAQVHYIPLYRQPLFAGLGSVTGSFPAADAYYAGTLSLPLHPTLTHAEQDHVVAVLRRAMGRDGDHSAAVREGDGLLDE
jgi:UDP-4-amino-4,6-dideoxy-N-acetyl-beta-L-altrosamine transaminase